MNASALPSSEPFKQRWPEKKKKKKEWGEGREQKHMHTQKQQPKKKTHQTTHTVGAQLSTRYFCCLTSVQHKKRKSQV